MNQARTSKPSALARRTLLLAAAAGAGAVGWWWRQRGESDVDPAAGATAGETGSTSDIWQLRFARPDGGELALAEFRGRPLLLNFWGSWCPPCVAEMPELDRFAQEKAGEGWQVLGLAVDNPKAVRAFLAQHPVGYHIAMAGFEGAGLTRQLGNSQGGLPFSVLFNARGELVQRKIGQISSEELRAWGVALQTQAR